MAYVIILNFVQTIDLKKMETLSAKKGERTDIRFMCSLKKRGREARRCLLDGDGLALQLLLFDLG